MNETSDTHRELKNMDNIETIEALGRQIVDLKYCLGRVDLIVRSESHLLSEFQQQRILQITQKYSLTLKKSK